MTDTWAETENGEYTGKVDSSVIFDAPDYASMLKHTSSASAKEYEAKINAMLKSGVIASIRAENYADAATLLHFGPGLAQSIADMSDVSDKTKKILDIITAPESPAIALIFTAIPMGLQFMRNHKQEIDQISLTRKEMRKMRKEAKARGEVIEKEPGLQVKLPFGKAITLPIRVKLIFWSGTKGIFQSQTYEPNELTKLVFDDPKVKAALKKQRIIS